MLSKIKTALVLIFIGLMLHSVYIIRMTDDALTIENYFKRENIAASVIFLIMVIGITMVSGGADDDD